MATGCLFHCTKCNQQIHAGNLFDCLIIVANDNCPVCPSCNAKALGAGGRECTVLDCFLPDKPDRWRDEDSGQDVTFYPFLVITMTENGKVAWLPYWHVTGKGSDVRKKYGQWAPSMDLSTFQELVEKARAKGYLTPHGSSPCAPDE
jgi:hypothetical protein